MKEFILVLCLFLFSLGSYEVISPGETQPGISYEAALIADNEDCQVLTANITTEHAPQKVEKADIVKTTCKGSYDAEVIREVVQRPKDSDLMINDISIVNGPNNMLKSSQLHYEIAEVVINKRKQSLQIDKQHSNYGYPFTGNDCSFSE